MNKKIILAIVLILIIIGGVFYFSYKQQRTKNQVVVPVIEQPTGKTNNFENSQLVEIAKQYVLIKPQLYWNREKFVNWASNELGTDFAKASPEWIVLHKSTIKYIEPNTYKSPYDDLNDKYIVGWFFIPGCEENPNSTNRPNWFNKAGLPCLGGYSLSVIINSDGTVNHAELNALD